MKKQKPMSPKFAATALLLATTTGAILSASPAQAAESPTNTPPPIIQTVSQYDLSGLQNPSFIVPPVSSWAVSYTANTLTPDQAQPAAQALADAAQAQQTSSQDQAMANQVAQQQASEVKQLKLAAQQKKIADQEAADKATADKAAAAKAAADKAVADKAAADKAAADKIAADNAAAAQQAQAVAAQQAAQAQAAQTTSQSAQAATATPAQTQSAPAPTSTPTPTSTVSGTAKQRIVQLAYQYLGVPYVWGGSTPSGWDCSGMVQYVVNHATGAGLPRTATDQMNSGLLTRTSTPQPGDLVFFTDGGSAYHVGIYIGGGQMIHAPVPGQVTQVSAVWGTPTYMSLNG